MTTDAPPEKMMLEPCGCGGDATRGDRTTFATVGVPIYPSVYCNKCGINVISVTWDKAYASWNTAMGREAARRLSARAAPRVWDGPPLIRIEGVALKDAAEDVVDAFALSPLDAAAKYGPDFDLVVFQDDALKKLSEMLEYQPKAALSAPPAASAWKATDAICPTCGTDTTMRASAPPAASADARERIADLICAEGKLDRPHDPNCANRSEHLELADAILALSPPSAEREELENMLEDIINAWAMHDYSAADLAKRLHAAGYRKLAPAQSVGQSAAQGELRNAAEEACEHLEKHPYLSESDAAVSSRLRAVLSALPKGQDDE